MKLIIFDLDQTLVDFLSVHDEVTRRLFEDKNIVIIGDSVRDIERGTLWPGCSRQD